MTNVLPLIQVECGENYPGNGKVPRLSITIIILIETTQGTIFSHAQDARSGRCPRDPKKTCLESML